MRGGGKRIVTDNKIRCGSSRHQGDRMVSIDNFCKAKTPDGLSYSCKACRTIENKELCAVRWKRYKEKNPLQAMFSGRKSDAKKRGIKFTLTIDDITIPDVCPVLGIPIICESGARTNNSPSIDRIDNTKGYTPNNSIVISWRANLLKKNATLQELQQLSNFYTTLEENKNDKTISNKIS